MVEHFNGQKLKELRKSKNITATEIAFRMGYSQSYISRFENNKAIPDVDTLAKILDILGTNLSEFFFENENSSLQRRLSNLTSMMSEDQLKSLVNFLELLA